MVIHSYLSADQAARQMTEALLKKMEETPAYDFRIALSGGKTPALWFDIWLKQYAHTTPWQRIQFYWVDERCVPASSPDSNYGMAYRLLLEPLEINPSHVHPIRGENNPAEEAIQYSALVKSELPEEAGIPIFDVVFLGVGSDGHTSSVFPGHEQLLTVREPYAATVNPQGQSRIAMTGYPMIRARNTWFLVTGEEKREIVEKITEPATASGYPAGWVLQEARSAEIFSFLGE